MAHAVIGLDIGGANLKAAHSDGTVRSQAFALWRDPAGLPDALRGLLSGLPPADELAVTMTGELCDCYESKRQGVNAILDAVEAVAEHRSVQVWQTPGHFVNVATARTATLQTAAANWLALATFAGRLAPVGPAVLIDIGSTTTDLIPLLDGRPVPRGWTDPERLQTLELVYTGVRRTPACALCNNCFGVAAELFATTGDVYLVLGHVPEDRDDTSTADGRPATRAAAHARLARMLCADLETSTEKQRCSLAEEVMIMQKMVLTMALQEVLASLPQPPATILLAGEGEFLARSVLSEPIGVAEWPPLERVISIAALLGPETSRAACAYALAVLASERPV